MSVVALNSESRLVPIPVVVSSIVRCSRYSVSAVATKLESSEVAIPVVSGSISL